MQALIMQPVKNFTGKNALWIACQNAPELVYNEILLELKKAGLYRHWYTVACKEGHDLPNAKATMRDIFIRLMPESAPLFGLPIPKQTAKKHKPAVHEGTLPLFE